MEIYEAIKSDIITLIIIYVGIVSLRFAFKLDLDDTDKSDGTRSDLKLYTDYGTGIQYLSTRNGQLIPRLSSDGKTIMKVTQR